LVLAGTLTLVIGVIVTVTLLIRRDNCADVSPSNVCQGYTGSIHWSFFIIVAGGLLIVAAGVAATSLVQKNRGGH
jgi:hypothetical protein